MNIRKVYNTSCQRHDTINCLIHSDNRIKCILSVNFVVTEESCVLYYRLYTQRLKFPIKFNFT